MYTANHPAEADAARAQIAVLRSKMRPEDPESLLKAGYWIAILNALRITPDGDGPDLVRRAAGLRPNDPEYQFLAALAFFDTDKGLYQMYWERAIRLAKPGTAVSTNLQNFAPALLARLEASR